MVSVPTPPCSRLIAKECRNPCGVMRLVAMDGQRLQALNAAREQICVAAGRLCVRVDLRAPRYGESSDYLVVRGY
jgi:hypothetical protein